MSDFWVKVLVYNIQYDSVLDESIELPKRVELELNYNKTISEFEKEITQKLISQSTLPIKEYRWRFIGKI